jgi:hypothetical protein
MSDPEAEHDDVEQPLRTPREQVGFVTEVSQLAESGAGTEIGHRRSVGVALGQCVRFND